MPHGLYTPKNIRKPRVCNPVNFHVHIHCVKSVRIQSYSGPHFPRITPNTDTFYAVILCTDNGFNKKNTPSFRTPIVLSEGAIENCVPKI